MFPSYTLFPILPQKSVYYQQECLPLIGGLEELNNLFSEMEEPGSILHSSEIDSFSKGRKIYKC